MKSKLYFFEQNMDGPLIRRILKLIKVNLLLIALQDFVKIGIFSRTMIPNTRRKNLWILNKLVGNRKISHPAKSPNLNPMEDMWSYLDRKVKAAKCTSVSSLKRVLTREWNALPWSEIRKSTSSMDQVDDKVIEMRGARIPY